MATSCRFVVARQQLFRGPITACAALFCSMMIPCEAQDNPRTQISLKPARWQTLPLEIRTVRFGPDGRGWLGLIRAETKESDVRAALEREYREQTPQLRGVSLALLEPDGRAWFYVKANE